MKIVWNEVNEHCPPFAEVVEVLYEDGSRGFDSWIPSSGYMCNWSKVIYEKTSKKVTHWAQSHLTQRTADAACAVCQYDFIYVSGDLQVCARCGASR